MAETCRWCRRALAERRRVDAIYCSKPCRQAHHRFGSGVVSRDRARVPVNAAYADPPYPGLSELYYSGHHDYAGEVDHAALVSRLQDFDGWALSTSSDSLPLVLGIVARVAPRARPSVAAWFRGGRPNQHAKKMRRSWEPVVYVPARSLFDRDRVADDSLHYTSRPRTTDPNRVIGAKPAPFCWWLFELLGLLPGDSFEDLFPGSGGVTRAWKLYENAGASVASSSSMRQRRP